MHVLVVDADPSESDALTRNLRRHGYQVERVETGTTALRRYRRADLLLLDLDLPDIDGLEVCRAIRGRSELPIITLTERGDVVDRVLGLQAGSDDFLVKPYGFQELMARIEAVMRRVHPRPSVPGPLTHGPLRINPRSREARLYGEVVELTRKEFDLLHLLASRAGAVVSRKEVMSQVWGHVWTTSSRTLDMHVSSLRRKLGDSDWIVTVRGVGFRLVLPASEAQPLPRGV